MDPLSVSASIIGLLSVASKIVKALTTLVYSAKGVLKSEYIVLIEVSDVRACLSQLQSFLPGTRTASRSWTSLLMVEQVLVTLTGCVLTFSELGKITDTFKVELPLRAVDRFRWMLKEQTISKCLRRLRNSKALLKLMLTALTLLVAIFLDK